LALGLLKQFSEQLCYAFMSTSTPIIPPGSPLQRQRPPSTSRFFVTVCAILAVHVVLLAGLLIQGCKREDRNVELTTNREPAFVANNPETNTAPNAPQSAIPQLPPNPVNPVTPGAVNSGPIGAATNPSAVAGAEPLTNALGDLARPSVTRDNAPTVAPPAAIDAGPVIYTVKQGDTLTRIARAHGISVRALRALNDLKTDRILVGQKLKIPAKAVSPGAAPVRDTNAP
jgi:LysM repeat protein